MYTYIVYVYICFLYWIHNVAIPFNVFICVFGFSSIELIADIKDKKGKSTKYHYKANKLPERINTAESKTMV